MRYTSKIRYHHITIQTAWRIWIIQCERWLRYSISYVCNGASTLSESSRISSPGLTHPLSALGSSRSSVHFHPVVSAYRRSYFPSPMWPSSVNNSKVNATWEKSSPFGQIYSEINYWALRMLLELLSACDISIKIMFAQTFQKNIKDWKAIDLKVWFIRALSWGHHRSWPCYIITAWLWVSAIFLPFIKPQNGPMSPTWGFWTFPRQWSHRCMSSCNPWRHGPTVY